MKDFALYLAALASLVEGQPVEEGEFLVLRRAEFLEILEERPQVSERMLAHLAGRLRELETREHELRNHAGAGGDPPRPTIEEET